MLFPWCYSYRLSEGVHEPTYLRQVVGSLAANVSSSVIRPLLLIYDGCASRYSKRIVEKAIEMSIVLLLLSSNSTHILPPLDESVLKPLKTSLRHSMDRIMIDEDVSKLTKKQAISLLSSAWQNGVLAKPKYVISGFVSTCLWPISAPKCVHVENCKSLEVLRTVAYQATPCGS